MINRSIISLLMLAIILLPVHSVSASPLKGKSLSGVIYDGKIRTVSESDRVKDLVSITSFKSDNAAASINLNVKLDGQTFNLSAKGTVYSSHSELLKGANSITIDFEALSELQFLSFVIEERAIYDLLLPMNQHLSNQPVLKLALKNTSTNQIIYIEESLPSEVDLNKVKNTAITTAKLDSKVIDKLIHLESWFFDYTDKIQLNNSLNKNETQNAVIASLTSPVPGVPITAFTLVGTNRYSDDSYGYYRETIEHPVGTGNRWTKLVKWSLVSTAPDTIISTSTVKTGTIDLRIVTEAQYMYVASTNVIQLHSTGDGWDLRNVSVEVGLAAGNSNIISRVDRDATVNSGSIAVNWAALVGVLPIGTAFQSAAAIFGAFTYKSTSSSGNVINYHTKVSDNNLVFGNSLRGYKLSLKSGDKLNSENDGINFDFDVRVPTDIARSTGTKKIFYKFKFQITNGEIINTVLNDFERSNERSYTVS
ncbi:hypothetical protein ACFQZE_21505 [Paenibacillus sp. GCM10027627]|uniref:hypothetical protein n=1 Tax=unclassified Paenibacillus TaxID=185978 RepID=UPI003637C2B6